MLASMVMIFVVGVGVGWMAGNQPAAPGGADESFVFSLVGGSEDQIRVSGPDFPFQLGGPDLIVALH